MRIALHALLSCAAAASIAARQPVTPEAAIERVLRDNAGHFGAASYVQPSWTPDSRSLAVTVQDPEAAGTRWVEIIDLAGKRRRLAEGSQPKVSPNGHWIAFLAGPGADRQLWVMTASGEHLHKLTELPQGLGNWYDDFDWAPDSKRIAFVTAAQPARQNAVDRQPDPQTALTVVVYAEARDVPSDAEVWLTGLQPRTTRRIASFSGTLAALKWAANSEDLIVYANRIGAEFREQRDLSEVRAIDVGSGRMRTLASGGGAIGYATPSPDGRSVALFHDDVNVRYPDLYSVSVVPRAGGALRTLTPKVFALMRMGPQWASDGSGLYYTMRVGAFKQFFFVTMDGQTRQLTRSAADHRNPAVSPDGRHLAWDEATASGDDRLIIARADGSHARVLLERESLSKQYLLGKVRELRWKSRDGLAIAGFLTLPPDYDAKRRYPLFVDLHGGPVDGLSSAGQTLCIGKLEPHMWAAKGFVVLTADFRSSGAFGWEAIEAGRENQDFLQRDFDDVMAGVDHLIASGIADANRLALGGHSYGATLTNWVITHTDRFKAAISYEGSSDMFLDYGSEYSVGGNTWAEWQFKGRPWEVPDHYLRNSALFMMKGVRTPTLFILGDGTAYGGTEPHQYEFMYTALKQQGVPTELVKYRGEGHVIRGAENVKDLTLWAVRWVDAHLAETK